MRSDKKDKKKQFIQVCIKTIISMLIVGFFFVVTSPQKLEGYNFFILIVVELLVVIVMFGGYFLSGKLDKSPAIVALNRQTEEKEGRFNKLYILPIAAVIFFVLAVFVQADEIAFRLEAMPVMARIESIKQETTARTDITAHTVYVSFDFNGEHYSNVEMRHWHAGMNEGESIALLCNPQNPYEVQVDTVFSSAALILFIVGVICSFAFFYYRKHQS